MYRLIAFLAVLFLALPGRLAAQTSSVDDQNKALYDQTVDKLNFRTIEYVYDRKYPRKKFPASMNNFKVRKTFDDFENDERFKKLFMNYNDVSEKFKQKFGKGKYDLATFEKALSDILINKDFEFFISSLNKDDKVQLIRSLQQINKKGIAQFVDATGKPRGIFATDSVIAESNDPIVKSNRSQTRAVRDTNEAVINTAATPEEVFMEKTPRRDWLTWLALLTALGALLLAATAKFQDIPGLRSFMSNNYQKRSDNGSGVKPVAVVKSETTTDPLMIKKLDNLTREVEGLYAQMDELLHKNAVLEQKLAQTQPKPYDQPKGNYFRTEPETPVAKPETSTAAIPVTPVDFKASTVQQDELSGEAVEIPEVNFFLGEPDPHGFFLNKNKTFNYVPNESLYIMTLANDNAGRGQIEVVEDPAVQELALSDPERFLAPVCDISGLETGGHRIETEAPGTIIQNEDQWVLVKKARIRIV